MAVTTRIPPWGTKFKPLLGTFGIPSFEQGGIFIVSHLLLQGATVFVLSKGTEDLFYTKSYKQCIVSRIENTKHYLSIQTLLMSTLNSPMEGR